MTARRPLAAPGWLTARPIAHRGLHRAAEGIVENTRAAAEAAISAGYAIECDVQRAGDGEAMVFHDFTLERLTAAQGRLDASTAQSLAAIPIDTAREGIATLPAFLAAIGGRTPLIIEIKSRFDGDLRLAGRVLAIVSAYAGPVAVKSFDPAPLACLRQRDPPFPLGLVAQARYDAAEWPELTPQRRIDLAALSDFAGVAPDFLSWRAADLPHATPQLCRAAIGMPVMVWTIRSKAAREEAARWADQIVFEGFSPECGGR